MKHPKFKQTYLISHYHQRICGKSLLALIRGYGRDGTYFSNLFPTVYTLYTIPQATEIQGVIQLFHQDKEMPNRIYKT
jgi:hypothetical protein